MWESLSYLPGDDTKQLPMGEWFYELSWYLSQHYYRIHHNRVDYILYLRGCWKVPWQAYVIRNAASLAAMNEDPAVWSGDMFELHNFYLRDIEQELAKHIAISLFYEFDGNFVELRSLLYNM